MESDSVNIYKEKRRKGLFNARPPMCEALCDLTAGTTLAAALFVLCFYLKFVLSGSDSVH